MGQVKSLELRQGNVALQKAEEIHQRYSRITSVADARSAQSQTLRAVMRVHGQGEAEAIIAKELVYVMQMLNIKGKMSPSQIKQASQVLYTEYGHYKISEIFYIINQAMLGRYGKFYDKIDLSDIGSWFEKYDAEKMGICLDSIDQEHEKYKQYERR